MTPDAPTLFEPEAPARVPADVDFVAGMLALHGLRSEKVTADERVALQRIATDALHAARALRKTACSEREKDSVSTIAPGNPRV